MAYTVKDLLAIKKMAYSQLVSNQDSQSHGRSRDEFRGGRGGRAEVDHLVDVIMDLQGNDFAKLLNEIQYLETNLNSSFESVSFMMSKSEQRNLDCLADKDEA